MNKQWRGKKRQKSVPAIEREKREWSINFICLAAKNFLFFFCVSTFDAVRNGFLIIFLQSCKVFLCAHLSVVEELK